MVSDSPTGNPTSTRSSCQVARPAQNSSKVGGTGGDAEGTAVTAAEAGPVGAVGVALAPVAVAVLVGALSLDVAVLVPVAVTAARVAGPVAGPAVLAGDDTEGGDVEGVAAGPVVVGSRAVVEVAVGVACCASACSAQTRATSIPIASKVARNRQRQVWIMLAPARTDGNPVTRDAQADHTAGGPDLSELDLTR